MIQGCGLDTEGEHVVQEEGVYAPECSQAWKVKKEFLMLR